MLLDKAFRTVSDRSRRRKLELFYQIMQPTPQMRILDLGGEASHANQPNKQLLDVYPHRDRLVLVNLFFPNAKRATEVLPGLTALCGDGLRLPFADKSFDVCYCNAVIEHLFNYENQVKFAREIMRVAKRWFVTTPNRWFPFEPHMRLPFVTWLPQSWQHSIGYRFGYHHLRKRYASGCDRTELRLLSRRQLARLFPGSRIIRNGVPGFTPTYIAAGPESLLQSDRSSAPVSVPSPTPNA
jgi:SAM-dependent methyltransferase